MRRRLSVISDRLLLTAWRASVEMVRDRGHRDAAQIGFFAVLSFVPLALLVVAAFGLFFDDAEVRRRVVTTVFDSVPLAQPGDRARLEGTVSTALDGAGNLGPFTIVLLIAAASGVMGALRHAINQAWDIEARPPLLRRKAIDLALVSGGTLVLLLSLSVTATHRAANFLDDKTVAGAVVSVLLDAIGGVLPLVLAAAVILFLYRVLPLERPRTRDIWPGAVVAALLLGLVKVGLELYLSHLSNFGALYGSLGAFMALLLFVYAAALVLVFGAEFASEWARLPGDDAEVRRLVRRGAARARRLGR
jgi:membrane protein